MNEYWVIYSVNDLDAKYGCDPGAEVYMEGLDKAMAKAIARHMNKTTPDFVWYFAKEEPQRWS